ncbi:hypothetical protein BJ878DRAFT_317108 [Calycina marina]|uniref:Zn(2)-C6 fungal-type domain-containing protein n=1 Tax=Calycina marina TaxID=1763456 RepID=A0A9P7YUB8_9HELO|nr:hypothetical protein BJ878DRAFT_317108 [Calycina marina]
MHRANIRERLKTKSGCLTCRERKKKCDETVPVCRACHRNKWPCPWTGKRAMAHDHEISPLNSPEDRCGRLEITTWIECPPNSNSIAATTIPTTTPGGLLLKPRYILSDHFFLEGFRLLLRPDVYVGFVQDLSPNIISIGTAYPCATDLFLAFSALFISNKHSDAIPFALDRYAAATSSAISQIQDTDANGSEIWLMTMACVMCVFEVYWPVNLSLTICVLTAIVI